MNFPHRIMIHVYMLIILIKILMGCFLEQLKKLNDYGPNLHHHVIQILALQRVHLIQCLHFQKLHLILYALILLCLLDICHLTRYLQHVQLVILLYQILALFLAFLVILCENSVAQMLLNRSILLGP